MSNNPRNSNLNEDQNINHVTERFHDPNHRRDHKLLLLYTESESSAVQIFQTKAEDETD